MPPETFVSSSSSFSDSSCDPSLLLVGRAKATKQIRVLVGFGGRGGLLLFANKIKQMFRCMCQLKKLKKKQKLGLSFSNQQQQLALINSCSESLLKLAGFFFFLKYTPKQAESQTPETHSAPHNILLTLKTIVCFDDFDDLN
jgi:hypothetical protein